MELSRELKYFLLFLLFVVPAKIWAQSDIPTIEALIDAHKKMKKAEDLAVLELTTIAETQSLTQKTAKAYNRSRTLLNKRMSDANSYLTLASQLTNITLKMKTVIDNYSDFTGTTFNHVKGEPFLLAYYVKANLEITREIKHISQLIGSYAATGMNLLKATMHEKYKMLSLIESSIARINGILWRTNLVCRSIVKTGVREWHVEEISKASKTIANDLIALWKQKQSKE